MVVAVVGVWQERVEEIIIVCIYEYIQRMRLASVDDGVSSCCLKIQRYIVVFAARA